MQRLIDAIDKGVQEGLYTLEETANILQAIDQIGQVVQEYNKNAKAAAAEEARLTEELNSKVKAKPKTQK